VDHTGSATSFSLQQMAEESYSKKLPSKNNISKDYTN